VRAVADRVKTKNRIQPHGGTAALEAAPEAPKKVTSIGKNLHTKTIGGPNAVWECCVSLLRHKQNSQTRCHSAVPERRRRSCKPTSRGSTLTVEQALYKEGTHGALVTSQGVPCGLSAERNRHPPREASAARAARTPWWRRGERQHSLAPQWAADDRPRPRADSARHPAAATYVQRLRRRTVFRFGRCATLTGTASWRRELL
jgi:hypothetical protein